MTTRTRRRLAQGVRRLAVVGAAAALTAALAQTTTTAAFTAQTDNGSNQASTAATFCTSTGETRNPVEDSTGYEANPTTSYGSHASVGVASQNTQDARTVIRFPMPALPQHCTLVSATLRLWATRSDPGATVDVYRIDPAATGWTEAGVTWNTLPAVTGTAVTGGTPGVLGWQEWTVTGLVADHYSTAVNSGLLLRERVENAAGGGRWQLYDSRESPNVPQLVLTWG